MTKKKNKGGRPKKEPNGNPSITQSKPTDNPPITQQEPAPNPTGTHKEPTRLDQTRLDLTGVDQKEVRASHSLTPSQFLKEWNAAGLTQASIMSEKRCVLLRARLRVPHWVTNWREALSRASSSPFCTGQGDGGWIANVDWFLRPDTVTQILEGKYDRKFTSNSRSPPGSAIAEKIRSRTVYDESQDLEQP